MARVLDARACDACALAKRKCGKQTPHCTRCRRRGIECTYRSRRPTSFVVHGEDDTFPETQESLSHSTSGFSAYSLDFPPSVDDDAGLSLGLDLPGLSSDVADNQLASRWFLSSEAWKIDHFPPAEHNSFCVRALKQHMLKIHRWLAQWIEKGSNPFIHPRLYGTRFPRCVQDAYSALSCYLQRTESNEQIVFHIIQDRAKQLVNEYGISSEGSSLENIGYSPVTLDALEHTARVQALLVYQILGLFDGDIRMRHLAESHIPVLNSWMIEMVEHASQAASLGSSVVWSTDEQKGAGYSLSDIAHYGNLAWYSWILAESIRRTWLVASGIQAIYMIIQQGRAVSCQGGMTFTTRQGVWEAQTALAWKKLCSEVDVGLIQIAEADKLFTRIAPEDVNEFTTVILQGAFGAEWMERWGVQI